jgi:hypothetical protein
MQLAKTSWGVLREDKQLAVIPVVSAACSAVVMAVMGIGIFATVHTTSQVPNATRTTVQGTVNGFDTYSATPLTWVVVIAGYLVLSIVVTFCTAALIAAAHEKLTGGEPTIGGAFGTAASHFPQLLGFALINFTVGLILRAIADQGIVGQIAASLLNFAWTVVSWLAVPFIVINDVGPIDALKQSAEALKRTWGENLTANIGLGILNLFVMLGAVVLFAIFALPGLWLVGIVVTLVYIAIAATILSALSGIYRTALFMYAVSGTVPQGFDQEVMEAAFRTKKKRMGIV